MTKEQMESIVQENMQKIYLYCVKKLENSTAAEDVASDVIFELLRSYEKIRNDEAIYGYMWSVANNLCRNYWRRSAKNAYAEIPDDFVGASCISPEEKFVQEEEILLLRRELSLLKEKYRQIVTSYYMDGLSCERIAEKYKLSVSNVKQCLFEGRKQLKEGMDMVREYGELSYAPEKFAMNFWGDSSSGYWELFKRKLPGNIIIAAYEEPKTLEELSLEMGVSIPYLEDEVEILANMGLMVRKGKTYQSNMVLYDEVWRKSVYDKATDLLREKLPDIKNWVEEGVTYLADTDYCYENADENTKRWFVLMMIIWEASELSETLIKTKLTFPLLENGSKGYVMGIRGEFHSEIEGIYGHNTIGDGFIRILNFKKISERVLHLFAHGNAESQVIRAAIEGKRDIEEVEVLSSLLENGFVRVKDGVLRPEFATISYADYDRLKDQLSEGIAEMTMLVAKSRDMAGEELRKKTPSTISGASEIGTIVSMWSMMESLVALVIQEGYLTKADGQNPTIVYFKTEKE